jgi:hypothetical protein
MVFLVSSSPGEERKAADAAVQQIRLRFARALLIGVCLPGLVLQQGSAGDALAGTDKSSSSLVDALQICLDWLEERTKA